MKSFYYRRPSSIEEACDLLREPSGQVKALAGGTDLLIATKQGKLRPNMVVSLRDIPTLSFIRVTPGSEAVIGSMVSLEEIELSNDIRSYLPAVAEAASYVGSTQVRTRATMGGNLCNAAPSADMAPILMANDASIVLADCGKERTVKLDAFFTGPGKTVMKSGELMSEIRIPISPKQSFSKYLKVGRSSMDIAVVGVAVRVDLEVGSEICKNVRLILGAVGPTPIRAKASEFILEGKELSDDIINKVAESAVKESRPISDVRSSESYRRHMVRVLTRRALSEARSWAKRGGE